MLGLLGSVCLICFLRWGSLSEADTLMQRCLAQFLPLKHFWVFCLLVCIKLVFYSSVFFVYHSRLQNAMIRGDHCSERSEVVCGVLNPM